MQIAAVSAAQSKHHKQVPGFQGRFKTHVNSMMDAIKDLGNPFSDSKELSSLMTKDTADASVVKTVKEIKAVGFQQFEAFVKERLIIIIIIIFLADTLIQGDLQLTSAAILLFHAMTGCDTVSGFAGRGKAAAWDVWMSYDKATAAFLQLAVSPDNSPGDCLAVLERFNALLYDCTSELDKHIRRAVYQGGHVWGQSTVAEPILPDPACWGWKLEGNIYCPFWTTLTEATKSCQELVCCGCKKGCSSRCSCAKAGLQCTALCACDRQCITIYIYIYIYLKQLRVARNWSVAVAKKGVPADAAVQKQDFSALPSVHVIGSASLYIYIYIYI
ncbi:UNVERIFIED_CONTAM: hypothetical protein FKN15_013815 [Acipenser sinensis]